MTEKVPTTIDVPAAFAAFCQGHSLSVGQVLAAFMADLADTDESNGSDERMHADAWFDRVVWPEPPERTYTIEARPPMNGGGWKVTFFEDGEEAGGGVFPADPNVDPEDGMNWWNSMPETERKAWMHSAGDSGRVVDAYVAFLTEEARAEAEDAAEQWVGEA